MATLRHSARALLAIALTATAAVAQSPDPSDDSGAASADEDVIVIEGLLPSADEARAERALREPAIATVIRIDSATPAATTLAAMLATSAGAQVRGLGGLGGFASISVRGHGAGQTSISIDGVPLSQLASATLDLGRLELHSFSTVELYRSAVPTRLGGAGLGGAVNLVTGVGPPADGRRTALSAGLGSFGARHFRARYLGGESDTFGFQLGASYAAADGDYPFFDDNGTNLNTDDDSIGRRANNGFDRLDLYVRARERRGELTAAGGARVYMKRQGLPGIGSLQTEAAELASAAGVLDLAIEVERLGRAAAYVLFDSSDLRDPEDEIGLGTGNRKSRTFTAGASAHSSRTIGRRSSVSLSGEGRAEMLEETDTAMPGADGSRFGGAVTGGAELVVGETIRVLPGARLEILRTAPADPGGSLPPRTDALFSPRIAAIARVGTDVAIKGSVAYAARAPTLVESFGDRGYLAGNPELRPEGGPAVDLGVVWAPAEPPSPLSAVFVEVAVFGSLPSDIIVYSPTAGGVAKPFNVDAARLLGFEITGATRLARHFSLAAAYTLLDASNRSDQASLAGKRLPNRARHQLDVRAGVDYRVIARPVSAWAELAYTGGSFLDQANVLELPPRAFVNAGARVELGGGFAVSVEGKNLADNTVENIALDPPPRPELTEVPRAVSDFFGYPLPGRAFYASAQVSF